MSKTIPRALWFRFLHMLAMAIPIALASHIAHGRNAPAHPAPEQAQRPVASENYNREPLILLSNAVVVVSGRTGAIMHAKNIDSVQPIASITKLMTALVILDTNVSLDGTVRIETDDIDLERSSKSKLRIGEVLPRRDLLRLALLASENRAASALARSVPGGTPAFVAAMNRKALALGMDNTHFVDASGLSSANVSTARDLAKLVATAANSAMIKEFSTTPQVSLTRLDTGHETTFRNTNLLVRRDNDWDIHLSKTGYINEAGHCLVMQASIDHQLVNIVLLDSWGRYSRIGDANRIKKWLQGKARVAMGIQ